MARLSLLFSVIVNPALALVVFALFDAELPVLGVLFGGGLIQIVMLWLATKRPRWIQRIALASLLVVILNLAVLEMLSGAPLTSIRVALVIFPLLATYLMGTAWTWRFWLLCTATGLGISCFHEVAVVGLIDAIVSAAVGLLIAWMAWISENARERAALLAAARQKRLEEAARAAVNASDAKGTFLATMSHEIRTPMNGVLGLTHLLLKTDLGEDQQRLAETILSSGEILLQVLNDVLDISRLERGKMKFATVPLSPTTAAREVLQLIEPLATRDGLSLRLRAHPDTPEWVTGDPTRLKQLLMNLLGNAVKFTRQGAIELRVSPLSSGLRFEIEDSGIGIAPEKISSLFEAFTQVNVTTTRRFGGSGLGLSICRAFCHEMGGRIGASSTLGVGSTFWFELPFPACAPPEPRIVLHAPVPPGARVLVAEDNPVNQLVTRRMLEELGCSVEVVSDGRAAIERFSTEPWDLVLMDCHMPVMDGWEACRHIRALDTSPRPPIVALTASATREDRERALAAGMDDLLAKPVAPRDLHAALARWLPTTD